MPTSYEEKARVFKAFCDPNRLRILELLRGGEKCACVLLEQSDLGQSGLSYHMKILTETGIVIGRPEGKWTIIPSAKRDGLMLALLKELTRPVEAGRKVLLLGVQAERVLSNA